MKMHKAIEFATLAHINQKRKSSGVPYIVHPFEVAQIISTMEPYDAKIHDDIIIAGLLHDTIEDCGVIPNEIETLFGKNVLTFVINNTEDKTLLWERRKEHTIVTYKALCTQCQMLIMADKLSNLRNLKFDYDKIGEKLWTNFNRGKEAQEWYYKSLFKCFSNFNGRWFYNEYKELINSLFSMRDI